MNKFRFALILAACVSLRALGAVTVTAELSADETSVGTPVQMRISVEGTTNVVIPDNLGVEGLESRLTGRQTLVQITNGRMTTSGVYTYTIIPMREGNYEIPPLEINADGHKETTRAQKLLVQAGTAPGPRPAPAMPLPPGSPGRKQKPAAAQGEQVYVEMIVPKTSIYVGEVVPVEIRVYFRGDIGVRRLQDEPQVSGEGFTVQKSAPPSQSEETIGDSIYRVVSFKTSIAAVKSGEMELPVATMKAILSFPTNAPAGMQSIFDQFFGGQGMADDREVDLKSKPKSIRVKALPAEGRPADFSGAVGDFDIAASADPTKVAAGDPMTLKIVVSGRGNFDAMGNPKLLDTTGWKVYPPTSRFEKSDAIGYGGTKNFEMPMVALQPQKSTPVAEFSFFNPDKEKYFSIKTQPVAIEAEADQSAQPAVAAAPADAVKPSPTPAPDPAGSWLSHPTARSWQPLAKWPGFWIANAAAALLLIGIAIVLSIRRARQGPAGHRAAQVRERDRIVRELGNDRLPDDAFYAKALESLAVQARLTGDHGPFELVRSLEARGRNVSDLHVVLARADELKFSGGGNAATRLDAEERRRIVRAILEVCR